MYHSRLLFRTLVPFGLALAAGCTGQAESAAEPAGEAAQQQGPGGYAGAPYLGVLRDEMLYGDVWERPGLSPRDRSLVTVAATMALYEDQASGHIGRGLDNGVTPDEFAELITHVAMYAGWPTGVKASGYLVEVLTERGLPLPQMGAPAPPFQGPAETGGYPGAPYLGVLRNTKLYGDVWERPGLSPRDRSLITVAATMARYEDQASGHIGRGLDNGVTPDEFAEMITHVAMYAGWPTGVKAAGYLVEVLTERGLPLPQMGAPAPSL